MNDKLKHKIINHLNKEYSGLVRYETDRWPDYIFFMKDGEVIFDYDKKKRNVLISYPKIWSFLETFFELECTEIRDLTKEWVVEQFKSDVTTTHWSIEKRTSMVEEHYKLDVTTTTASYFIFNETVEEHYKLETNER